MYKINTTNGDTWILEMDNQDFKNKWFPLKHGEELGLLEPVVEEVQSDSDLLDVLKEARRLQQAAGTDTL